MTKHAKAKKEEPRGSFAHRLKMKDDINTDYIISGRYKFKIQDAGELAKYVFADIEQDFYKRIKPGDFLIAGKNFGCGSSREQAPAALKATGLGAVVAESFARIFYRNAFNVGLCLIECRTNFIDDMDELEVDFKRNILKNLSKCVNIDIKPIPPIMSKFLEKGGVIEYLKEHGSLDGLM